MVQTDGRAGGQAYGHVIIKFFRMGRLLHFLPMVLRCASFARKSSAIIQRHSNFGSTTQYNMNRKTFRFIWLFRPSTADITIRYTTSSNTFKYVVKKLEQSWATVYSEYSQNRGQKKTCRKKTSVGSMAHALKIPSYEGYTAGRSSPLFTKQVFQQRTTNSKQFKETQTS